MPGRRSGSAGHFGGFLPEKIGHFIKMAEIKRRVARVERQARPVSGIKKPAAQGALQEIEAHERNVVSAAVPSPLARPVSLDLGDPLDDEFVVGTVRATMKRKTDARGRFLGRWKQLPVAPEIVDSQPIHAKLRHELRKRCQIEDLARHEVMALEFRRIAWLSGNVDAPEWQPAPPCP